MDNRYFYREVSMKTHYSLYMNIMNDNESEVTTFRLLMTNVCDGFKVYQKLLPSSNTRLVWYASTNHKPVHTLELRRIK